MKILLDANVLLNGIFNPLSFSSKLLNMSHSGSIQCCVIKHNISEAHGIMSRVQENTGVSLHDLFDASINKLKLSFLEPIDENELGPFTIVGGIKDAPLAAVAVRDGIAICTNDPDFTTPKAKQLGIKVQDPAGAVLMARGYAMELDMVFPGFLISATEGAFYVEAEASWGDFIHSQSLNGLWCIFDAHGVGGLYLDLNNGGLTYFAENGPTGFISLKSFPMGERTLKIVVSYNSTSGLSMFMGREFNRFKQKVSWDTHSSNRTSRITFWTGRKGNFGAASKTRLMAGFAKEVTESGANGLIKGNRPIIPSERIELEVIVRRYYL